MKHIEFSVDARQDIVSAMREFYMRERDEELSEFQASAILDFMLQKIGLRIYNQAIKDAHHMMSSRVEDILALEKRPR
ncbi:MAG: DUF2164 domain-containing protein [Bacillota bacterium]|nr:DUF2164 domain-containing protein [Bacillota bacterium]